MNNIPFNNHIHHINQSSNYTQHYNQDIHLPSQNYSFINPFQNSRLQRLKYKNPSQQIQSFNASQYISLQHKQSTQLKKKTDLQTSTNIKTNYIKNIPPNAQQSVIRALTSLPGQRNLKKNQRKRLANGGNINKSLRLKTQKQKQYNSNFQMSQKRPNNFSFIEKKNNKANIKVKYMENWLNDILIEFCYQQKFDSNIHNSALKKFQIDRNSLLSKGLNPDKIDRIFKSLFVYSLGFNKLLVQLVDIKTNVDLRKTIWKVYAMLLQYCANGEFETMVGQIQRDKLRKLNKMKVQIEKRQKIIQQSQQNQKIKNVKIYKQIKQLKNENTFLLNQKQIISQDYRQIEQAFNEEVSLRLKFQHRINQMHGIHRQLGNKHMRLFEDFNKLKGQYGILLDENKKKTKQIQNLTFQNIKFTEKIQQLNDNLEQKQQQLERSQYQIFTYAKKFQQLQNKQDDKINQQKDKQLQFNLIKFQLSNKKGIADIQTKTVDDLQRKLQILIEQNKNMFMKISQQRKRIQCLESNQFNLQVLTRNIRSQLETYEKKCEQKTKQISIIKDEKRKNDQKMLMLQDNLFVEVEKNKILNQDSIIFKRNIQQMKKINLIYEKDIQNYEIKRRNLEQIIRQKERIQNDANYRLSQKSQVIIKLNLEINNLEGKIRFIRQNLNEEKNMIQKKYDRLKFEKQQLQRLNTQKDILIKGLEFENQKCRKQEIEAKTKLKNQLFQKKNIQLRFQQSLLEMQDQNKYIKSLNIIISQLKQQKQVLKRQHNFAIFHLQNQIQSFQKNINTLKTQINIQISQIKKKVDWIHPMIFNDLQSNYVDCKNRLISLTFIYDDLVKKIQKKDDEWNNELIKQRKKYDKQKQQYSEMISSRLYLVERQVLFYKSKTQQLQIKIIQQEQNISNYRLQIQEKQTPKQTYLNNIINEKSQKLQFMINQNRILQQRNSQLNKQVFLTNTRMEELNSQIQKVANNMKMLMKQKAEIIQQKLKVQNKLQNTSQNYKIAIEELKKQKQIIETKFKTLKTEETIQSKKKNEEKKNFISLNSTKKNIKTQNAQLDISGGLNPQQLYKRRQIAKKIQNSFNYYNHIK